MGNRVKGGQKVLEVSPRVCQGFEMSSKSHVGYTNGRKRREKENAGVAGSLGMKVPFKSVE